MRDRERMKVDLADAKVLARFYLLDTIVKRLRTFAWLFVVDVGAFAYVGVAGFGGDIDRAVDSSQQDAQAARVVAVLVSDQHRVKPLDIFANQSEPARDLFGAESGINQNTSFAGNDQNCIAG
jgi:hypothetical protein